MRDPDALDFATGDRCADGIQAGRLMVGSPSGRT
jgi:hypothetical protein